MQVNINRNMAMKVLMFGWEFPPNISGGLGTACYGLTKGLSSLDDVKVTFVVPKVFGGEDIGSMEFIGAADIAIIKHKSGYKKYVHTREYLEVDSKLVPYVDPENYKRQTTYTVEGTHSVIENDDQGKLSFTGKYGPDLLSEIDRYAYVAGFIASNHTFDVIHAHDWLAYPAGIEAKRVSGKPLVIHVHATDFDRSGGSVNQDVYAIEKRGMDTADKIITVSNLTKKIVIEKYGINPEKVITVYNAVEPYKKINTTSRNKGFKEKIVTFLGRITLQKGPEYFIEAANLVLQKMDNVRFVMAGNGDMMHQMISRAAKLKISDKFHFTGFLKGDDVYQMLGMSDVYIMPSVSEPFGISPLEAMQIGVPVIISKQSGVSEILNHAIKIDFWDVQAMADAIHGILKYSSLSKELAHYGKKESINLSWSDSAFKVKQVYQSAISA